MARVAVGLPIAGAMVLESGGYLAPLFLKGGSALQNLGNWASSLFGSGKGNAGSQCAGKTIDPAIVRFSQDSINKNFGSGGSVDELATALQNGTTAVSEIPAIRLVERNGQLFTLDNRRLEAFRRAGVDVPYRMATPEEIMNEMWKFTSRNGGTSIRVRGE